MIIIKAIVFFIAVLFSIIAYGNIKLYAAAVSRGGPGRTNVRVEATAAGGWALFYLLNNWPE